MSSLYLLISAAISALIVSSFRVLLSLCQGSGSVGAKGFTIDIFRNSELLRPPRLLSSVLGSHFLVKYCQISPFPSLINVSIMSSLIVTIQYDFFHAHSFRITL